MTLFNDPVRVIGGRVVSLFPPHGTAVKRQPGWSGPTRGWTLAYKAPGAGQPTMARAQAAAVNTANGA